MMSPFHKLMIGLAMATGSMSAAHAAEMVVLEARGVNLRPGQTIDSSKPLPLKQGQHITLISASGVTLKLDGPYEKAPESDQAKGLNAASALSLLVTQREARVAEVGTTRGLAPNKLPDPWLLDASRPGTVCQRDGAPVVLWRPDAAKEATLTVAPVDRSWKTEARWPAGADRIVVPPPAAIRGGATYLVSLNGAQSAMKVENVPASLTSNAVRMAWLVGKECEAQAQALARAEK